MPQFDWLCDVCECVMSPTLGIYWVDLDFINNYKEFQLWLILLKYSADVTSAFPWVVTIMIGKVGVVGIDTWKFGFGMCLDVGICMMTHFHG